MRKPKVIVQVPGLLRDGLKPYAEMFEEIVIPMVRQVPVGMIDRSLARRLHEEITAYENRKDETHHCFLAYYGLMLCCMYTTQECFEFREPEKKGQKLNLIHKARLLISLAYQEDAYKLIPFML